MLVQVTYLMLVNEKLANKVFESIWILEVNIKLCVYMKNMLYNIQ